MKYFKDEKIRKQIFIGATLIVIFFALYHIASIWGMLKYVVGVLAPFILGAAIAFVLNVPMRWIESGLFRKRTGSRWAGARRVLAIVITLLAAFILVGLILYMIIPQLASTITQLIKQIPDGVMNVSNWFEAKFYKYPALQSIIEELANSWQKILESFTTTLKSLVNSALTGGYNAVTGILSGMMNFIIGFIFAIYILVQMEKLGSQGKKILYALFDRKPVEQLLSILSLASRTFSNFISGQCLEACILGMMFGVAMLICRLPYASLISILIAATSLIPVVGAFIGCVIGALLIILVSPVKALIFIVLFLVLQQIENNIIYPKVVGSSVGLPGIWVLVSVTVGGSLFGVAGMVTFIPLASVSYALLRGYVYKRLEEKGLRAELSASSGGDAEIDREDEEDG